MNKTFKSCFFSRFHVNVSIPRQTLMFAIKVSVIYVIIYMGVQDKTFLNVYLLSNIIKIK